MDSSVFDELTDTVMVRYKHWDYMGCCIVDDRIVLYIFASQNFL